MALTTAEVTAVSRNSGTRRIREDTQGHDQGANQAQGDTVGPAGSNPGPPTNLSSKSPILDGIRSRRVTAGAQIPGEPRNEAVKFVAVDGPI